MIGRFLFEPYEHGFMVRALVEVLLLGAIGAVVGVHVLLRRLAFLAEAVQHTVFPGIAIAFALGASLLVGALAAAVITVVLLVVIDRRTTLNHDAVLAVLIASFFAVGVVVVSRRTGFTADLNALLFGRITAVSWSQVGETALIGAVCVAILMMLHKELVLRAFDEGQAAAVGYPVARLDLVLNIVVALTVVLAVRALGTVLVVAFVVTPAAAARLVTRSVVGAMATAAVFAMALGWIGLSTSYEASVHHDIRLAAGATVVVAFTVGFLAVALAGRLLRRTARATA